MAEVVLIQILSLEVILLVLLQNVDVVSNKVVNIQVNIVVPAIRKIVAILEVLAPVEVGSEKGKNTAKKKAKTHKHKPVTTYTTGTVEIIGEGIYVIDCADGNRRTCLVEDIEIETESGIIKKVNDDGNSYDILFDDGTFRPSVLACDVKNKSSSSVKFRLTNNDIGDDGASAIAEGLTIDSTLTELLLSKNAIGDAGIKAIGEALKKNIGLSSLDLHKNMISTDGAYALAEGLEVNTSIQKLTISAPIPINEIRKGKVKSIFLSKKGYKDPDSIIIASLIKTNSTLETLYLQGNQISDAGAKAIAECLIVNSTLTGLYLHTNRIGDAGAEALSESLSKNETIKELYIYENLIEKQGKVALENVKKDHVSCAKMLL